MLPCIEQMPQPTDKATIRRATARDGEVLTSTVRGASAYAGEYRKIVRDVLISPEQIRRDHVYLCELDGEVAGFYALVSDDGGTELDFMFVADEAQRLGIGRLLFGHMKNTARMLGHRSVLIVSHPPAEPFYAKMGAVTVDREPPSGRVMWSRPRMRLELF